MDSWTDDQLDWMRHCIRLGVDRLGKPKDLTPQEFWRMRWEIWAQRKVMDKITVGLPLMDELIPVAQYLWAYADLHIEWYARRIDNKSFYEALFAEKKLMWERLYHAQVDEKGQGKSPDMEAMVEAATAAKNATG